MSEALSLESAKKLFIAYDKKIRGTDSTSGTGEGSSSGTETIPEGVYVQKAEVTSGKLKVSYSDNTSREYELQETITDEEIDSLISTVMGE